MVFSGHDLRAPCMLLVFCPRSLSAGWLWQPFTYSLIHVGILSERSLSCFRSGSWPAFSRACTATAGSSGLYAASVLGTALAAVLSTSLRHGARPSAGAGSALRLLRRHLRMLVAIGILYGDMEFLIFFTIGIKARYLAIIYGLIAIAMLFGQQRMYAFAATGRSAGGLALHPHGAAPRILVHLSASAGTGCATATTAGSAAAPPASSRSTCAPRAAPSLRRPGPPDRRRPRRQDPLELKFAGDSRRFERIHTIFAD